MDNDRDVFKRFKMNILTVIPARCGSKGIKDKNIIDICKKPLIAYSIESALQLKEKKMVKKVVVSTDCKKIADIALKYGAEVPFLRPKELATDKSKSIDFMIHMIKNLEDSFDAILLLQPTSPLRSMEILIEAIEKFKMTNTNSLISVYKEEYINDLVMYNINGKKLKPLNPLHNKGIRRQEHNNIYVRNGSIYLSKVDYLLKTKQVICDNPAYVEMKKSESINIDTIEDVKILKRSLGC